MAITTYKLYREILADMQSWIIANQDKVTDFNEGGVLSSFLEANARQFEEAYVRLKTGFESYLPLLPYSVFGFERKAGLYAAGTVVFGRTGTSGAVTIPSGTILATESGILFTTQEDGTIADASTTSASVSIKANELGVAGNVPAGTVTTIVSTVNGVETVTNGAKLTGGQDNETLIEFTRRFRTYIDGLGRSNVHGLVSAAQRNPGVRSASLVEHFPPESDIWNCSLYVDDGAGNAPSTLLAEVKSVVDGDGTEANPGYRAAGLNVRVLAPTAVTVDLTVEIESDGRYSDEVIEAEVESTVETYINDLVLGEDVIINRVREQIMSVDGVYDITSMAAPASNTVIGAAQIARFGTATITFTA